MGSRCYALFQSFQLFLRIKGGCEVPVSYPTFSYQPLACDIIVVVRHFFPLKGETARNQPLLGPDQATESTGGFDCSNNYSETVDKMSVRRDRLPGLGTEHELR